MIQARMAFTLILALLAGYSLGLAQPQPQREITPIKGELYRFRNAGHFSVFLVTPAGIIATDPLNVDAARWLKAELDRRCAKPVKYLIYSHDHADHISGGEVFADSAVVLAHDAAKAAILAERRPTAVPNVSFSDRLTIELGGKKVELIYLGKNHSDNSIVMRFADERVLFAVDFIPVKSLPFGNFPDVYVDEWIESLKKAEALDFDILAPGHGELGKKEDVGLMRVYPPSQKATGVNPWMNARGVRSVALAKEGTLRRVPPYEVSGRCHGRKAVGLHLQELHDQVAEHLRAGKSIDEIKQLVTMEKYSSWDSFKQYLPLNIEGMARHIQMQQKLK